ncbi:MAG TPA: hypothetical protein VJA26_05405 [Gammaproteobacteria bacterium]|nr:hypothetical protein [Gammaproteobacteria bacterium]
MPTEHVDRIKRIWLDGAQATLMALKDKTPEGVEDRDAMSLALREVNDEIMGDIARIHRATN